MKFMTSLRRLSFILCTTDVSTVRTVIETKAATQRVKLTIATVASSCQLELLRAENTFLDV